MLPFILALTGGYLIGSSLNNEEVDLMSKGGLIKEEDYFLVFKGMKIKRFRVYSIDGDDVKINYSTDSGTSVYTQMSMNDMKWMLKNGYIKKTNEKEYWKDKYKNTSSSTFAEGGIVDDLITKINAILQKEVPNFFHSVTKTKSYFGNEEQIAIKIAASDYEINNVRGQYPQLVSLLLNVNTMALNVQVFGGNGGQRIYRDINPNDPKEKFYAMIGIKVPFRTPQKNEKAVLNAIQKFVQNYKQALRDNIQTLRYKNNVDYETLLKN